MADEGKLSMADVSKKVFMAVGPVRIAGYSILSLNLMSGAEQGFGDTTSLVDTAMQRLDAAEKMLSEGALRLVKESGFILPAPVEKMRSAASSAVAEMRAAIKVDEADGARVVRIADVERFAKKILGEVDAKVTEFLAGLDGYAAEVEKAERDKERDVIKSAVGEIQTISMSINLISINASIEAARAGAAGRGFGVIANEIQTLSMRSQESLQKIMVNVSDEAAKKKRAA